jgi:hypothetical protein
MEKKLPKYLVRYQSREFYEIAVEADSPEDAEERFWLEDKIWEGHPYDSDTSVIEIEDEDGVVTYE